MKRLRAFKFTPQFIAGFIIAIHGLLRIVFIERYIDFVFLNFNEFVPSQSILAIGSGLFPFIEFFVGLMLLSNVNIKKSTWLAILISVVMSVFIVAAQLYTRLIYHVIIVAVLLLVLTQKQLTASGGNLLERPKGKIDTWSKYFF